MAPDAETVKASEPARVPAHFERIALLPLYVNALFGHLIAHGIALVALVLLMIWTSEPRIPGWAVLVGAIVLYLGAVFLFEWCVWRNLKVGYDAEKVVVSEGVIFKRQRILDLTHLQGLMFTSGPVLKLLHRRQVTAETAGGFKRPEVDMPALENTQAEGFEELVYHRAHAGADAATQATPFEGSFRLPLSYIFVSALTNNSVVWAALTIIVPLTTAIVQSLNSIDFNVEHIVDQGVFIWFVSLLGALIALILALVSISAKLLFDLARKLAAVYGYEVERSGSQLHTRRGLIVTRESFMDVRRVQALRIERPFLQRLLRFGALTLDTAGFSNKKGEGGSITSLAPIMRKKHMQTLIKKVLPEFATNVTGERSDLRGLGRFTFGPSMTVGIALAIALFSDPLWEWVARVLNSLFGVGASYALAWWTPWLAWIVALGALVFMVTEIDVWFATKAAVEGDMLVLQNGRLGRNEVRIHRKNIQGLTVRQTVFQKNDHHGHLKCYIISGSHGRCVTLRNLNDTVCAEIYDWYYTKTT